MSLLSSLKEFFKTNSDDPDDVPKAKPESLIVIREVPFDAEKWRVNYHRIKQSASQPALSKVAFKCSRPDGDYGLHKIHEVVFKRGYGPCGRYVSDLSIEVTPDLVTITQVSWPAGPPSTLVDEQLYLIECQLDAIHRECRFPYYYDPKQPHRILVKLMPGEVQAGDLESRRTVLRESKRAEQALKETKTFIYKISDIHGRIVTETTA